MTDTPIFQFEEKSGCLVIRVLGRDIIEDKEATFQALGDAIRTRSPRATLVDLRAVPGPVTFMDRFQIGEMTGRYLGQLNLASLLREEQTDRERIGQKVARNRGATVEVYIDPAEADAWLKKHAAPGK